MHNISGVFFALAATFAIFNLFGDGRINGFAVWALVFALLAVLCLGLRLTSMNHPDSCIWDECDYVRDDTHELYVCTRCGKEKEDYPSNH